MVERGRQVDMGDDATERRGDALIGATIGRYRIEELVGRGGMGVVYRAHDEHLGRTVAVKVLTDERAADPYFRDRFLRESRLLASLDHPNIVPVFEADELDGHLFIAMRYVPDPDLGRLIAAEGALGAERSVSIVSQVADALDAAHAAGLVHRDVKPGNVLIATGIATTPGGHAYLTDFGLTKSTTSRSGLTQVGHFVGTPGYIAPEQIEGEGSVDHRADVYALGCILYNCLTGDVPFPRESVMASLWAHVKEPPPKPSAHRSSLGPAFDGVIETALAKAPADRYQTCGALAAAARAALQGSGPMMANVNATLLARAHAATAEPGAIEAPTLPGRSRSAARTPIGDPRARLPLGIGIAAVVMLAVLLMSGSALSGATPSSKTQPVASASADSGVAALANGSTPTPSPTLPPDGVGPVGGRIELVGRFNDEPNRMITTESTVTVMVTDEPQDPSGIVAMAVSGSPARPSGDRGYAPSTTWTLDASSGTQTVYAWFMDAGGAWSEPIRASIEFDHPPVAGSSVRFGGVCRDGPQGYELLPYVATDRDGPDTLKVVALSWTDPRTGTTTDWSGSISSDGASAVLAFPVVGRGDTSFLVDFVVRDHRGADAAGVFAFDFEGC